MLRVTGSSHLPSPRGSSQYAYASPRGRSRPSQASNRSIGAGSGTALADLSTGSRILLDINAHTVDQSGRIALPTLEERCAALAIVAKYVLNFYTELPELPRGDGVGLDSSTESLTPEMLAMIKTRWDTFLNFKKNLLSDNQPHPYHFLTTQELLDAAGIDPQDAPAGVAQTIHLANCAILLHHTHQFSVVWSRSDLSDQLDIINHINLYITAQSVKDLRDVHSVFLSRIIPPTFDVTDDMIDLDFELACQLYMRREKRNAAEETLDEQAKEQVSNSNRSQFADTSVLRRSLAARSFDPETIQNFAEDWAARVESRLEEIAQLDSWDQALSEWELLDVARGMSDLVREIVGQLEQDLIETPVSQAVHEMETRISARDSPEFSARDSPALTYRRSVSAMLRTARGDTYPSASSASYLQDSYAESVDESVPDAREFLAERLKEVHSAASDDQARDLLQGFGRLEDTRSTPQDTRSLQRNIELEESQLPPNFGPRPSRAPPARLIAPTSSGRAKSPSPATRIRFDENYRLQKVADDRTNRFRDANAGVKLTVFDEDDPESQGRTLQLEDVAQKRLKSKGRKRARSEQVTEDEEKALSSAGEKRKRTTQPNVVAAVTPRRVTRSATRSQSVTASEAETDAREEDMIAASLLPRPRSGAKPSSRQSSREPSVPSELGEQDVGGDAPDFNLEDLDMGVARGDPEVGNASAADVTFREKDLQDVTPRVDTASRRVQLPSLNLNPPSPSLPRRELSSPIAGNADSDLKATSAQRTQRKREKTPATDDGFELYSEDSQDRSPPPSSDVRKKATTQGPSGRRPGLMPTGRQKAAVPKAVSEAFPTSIKKAHGQTAARKTWTDKETACLVKAIEKGVAAGKSSHIWTWIRSQYGQPGGKLERFDNLQYKDKARNICLKAFRDGLKTPFWQKTFFKTIGASPNPTRSQIQKVAYGIAQPIAQESVSEESSTESDTPPRETKSQTKARLQKEAARIALVERRKAQNAQLERDSDDAEYDQLGSKAGQAETDEDEEQAETASEIAADSDNDASPLFFSSGESAIPARRAKTSAAKTNDREDEQDELVDSGQV